MPSIDKLYKLLYLPFILEGRRVISSGGRWGWGGGAIITYVSHTIVNLEQQKLHIQIFKGRYSVVGIATLKCSAAILQYKCKKTFKAIILKHKHPLQRNL